MLNDMTERKKNTAKCKNDRVECKLVSLSIRTNQNESKLQLRQPCYEAKPSKLCILGNGSRWQLVAAFGISKSGFVVRGREKVAYWCIPFYHVYSLFILFHFCFFSFLCYFSLSSLYFLALVTVPSLFMATVTIYTSSNLWDFSILPLWLTNHFCLLWAPLQSCLLPYWLFNHHYIWACPLHSLSSTTHSMIDSNSFGSTMSLSPLAWMDKDLGLSSLTSLACIKWSQLPTTHFG